MFRMRLPKKCKELCSSLVYTIITLIQVHTAVCTHSEEGVDGAEMKTIDVFSEILEKCHDVSMDVIRTPRTPPRMRR